MMHRLARLRSLRPDIPTAVGRPFGTTVPSLLSKNRFPPRPKAPPDEDIEESYLKGSGPGGQKINKTSSAVQLKHLPTGIVVKSQATRSRSQNRKEARDILARKIDDLLNGDQSRSAIVGEVKRKKAVSSSKKSRRKYKKLEEEKAAASGQQSPPAEGSEQVENAVDQDTEPVDETNDQTKRP